MVVRLDDIEDAAVEDTGSTDATRRRRRQQVDAAVGLAVERSGAVDLEAEQLDERRCRLTTGEGSFGAEAADVFLRDVRAAPFEVLVDVAQEVRELERV